MSAHDRGWGPPGCSREQLTRVKVAGMIDTPPYFPLNVRKEVFLIFEDLCKWLVSERKRLGLPPLTCSGGYNKRLIRGSLSRWSNHSWGLGGDFCVATNPMTDSLITDMPPGTSAKARSLGLRWGGDYAGRKDPMHFEFIGTPADAKRISKTLSDNFTLGDRFLEQGSYGSDVRFLQELLKIDVDGDFGPNTKAALIKFQISARLKPDGVFGPATHKVLLERARPINPVVPNKEEEMPPFIWENPNGPEVYIVSGDLSSRTHLKEANDVHILKALGYRTVSLSAQTMANIPVVGA